MKLALSAFLAIGLVFDLCAAGEFTPGPQRFGQEIARSVKEAAGLPGGRVQLIEARSRGPVRAFVGGRWFHLDGERWEKDDGLAPGSEREFVSPGAAREPVRVAVPWAEVRQ